jgi:CheY-like chemotaxis protein
MAAARARVLLVEDVELNRDLVAQILDEDYELVMAGDGLEGVRLAREQRPSLILMDISLPGIDGLEATRRIKADAATAAIPVLALTAHAMTGDRERALAAGCDDFLTKPIDDELLLRKLHEWIERAAGGDGSRRPM